MNHKWEKDKDIDKLSRCMKCGMERILLKPKSYIKGYWYKGDWVPPKLLNFDIYDYYFEGRKIKKCDCQVSVHDMRMKEKGQISIFDMLGDKNG